MSLTRVFCLISIVYFTFFVSHVLYLNKTVYGDGRYYYSILHSLAVDHDINYSNQFQYFAIQESNTPKNIPANKYSIGAPILWFPFYIALHNAFKQSGYEMNYQLAIGAYNVALTIIGLILVYKSLAHYFTDKISKQTILIVAFCTNLLFYGSFDTVNSHAATFFLGSIIVAFITFDIHPFITAVAIGFAGMVRTQELLYLVLLTPYIFKKPLQILSGVIIGFLPQIIYWVSLNGSIISPYLSGSEGFSLLQPHLMELLTDKNIGLIVYTPVIFVSIVYIFFLNVKKGIQKNAMLFTVFLQVYLTSTWSTWWQGASFGVRMLIGSLPMVSFGTATLLLTNNIFHKTKNFILFLAIGLLYTLFGILWLLTAT